MKRFVVCLIIPCLLADPALASVGASSAITSTKQRDPSAPFTHQALSVAAIPFAAAPLYWLWTQIGPWSSQVSLDSPVIVSLLLGSAFAFLSFRQPPEKKWESQIVPIKINSGTSYTLSEVLTGLIARAEPRLGPIRIVRVELNGKVIEKFRSRGSKVLYGGDTIFVHISPLDAAEPPQPLGRWVISKWDASGKKRSFILDPERVFIKEDAHYFSAELRPESTELLYHGFGFLYDNRDGNSYLRMSQRVPLPRTESAARSKVYHIEIKNIGPLKIDSMVEGEDTPRPKFILILEERVLHELSQAGWSRFQGSTKMLDWEIRSFNTTPEQKTTDGAGRIYTHPTLMISLLGLLGITPDSASLPMVDWMSWFNYTINIVGATIGILFSAGAGALALNFNEWHSPSTTESQKSDFWVNSASAVYIFMVAVIGFRLTFDSMAALGIEPASVLWKVYATVWALTFGFLLNTPTRKHLIQSDTLRYFIFLALLPVLVSYWLAGLSLNDLLWGALAASGLGMASIPPAPEEKRYGQTVLGGKGLTSKQIVRLAAQLESQNPPPIVITPHEQIKIGYVLDKITKDRLNKATQALSIPLFPYWHQIYRFADVLRKPEVPIRVEGKRYRIQLRVFTDAAPLAFEGEKMWAFSLFETPDTEDDIGRIVVYLPKSANVQEVYQHLGILIGAGVEIVFDEDGNPRKPPPQQHRFILDALQAVAGEYKQPLENPQEFSAKLPLRIHSEFEIVEGLASRAANPAFLNPLRVPLLQAIPAADKLLRSYAAQYYAALETFASAYVEKAGSLRSGYSAKTRPLARAAENEKYASRAHDVLTKKLTQGTTKVTVQDEVAYILDSMPIADAIRLATNKWVAVDPHDEERLIWTTLNRRLGLDNTSLRPHTKTIRAKAATILASGRRFELILVEQSDGDWSLRVVPQEGHMHIQSLGETLQVGSMVEGLIDAQLNDHHFDVTLLPLHTGLPEIKIVNHGESGITLEWVAESSDGTGGSWSVNPHWIPWAWIETPISFLVSFALVITLWLREAATSAMGWYVFPGVYFFVHQIKNPEALQREEVWLLAGAKAGLAFMLNDWTPRVMDPAVPITDKVIYVGLTLLILSAITALHFMVQKRLGMWIGSRVVEPSIPIKHSIGISQDMFNEALLKVRSMPWFTHAELTIDLAEFYDVKTALRSFGGRGGLSIEKAVQDVQPRSRLTVAALLVSLELTTRRGARPIVMTALMNYLTSPSLDTDIHIGPFMETVLSDPENTIVDQQSGRAFLRRARYEYHCMELRISGMPDSEHSTFKDLIPPVPNRRNPLLYAA